MADTFGTVKRDYVADLLRAHQRDVGEAPWLPWLLEYLAQQVPPSHCYDRAYHSDPLLIYIGRHSSPHSDGSPCLGWPSTSAH
eukprot:4554689-Amphidinium_carterae.1